MIFPNFRYLLFMISLILFRYSCKVNDDLNNSSMLSSKRKAYANSTIAPPQITSKRLRQQSLSPPEDPSNANLITNSQQGVCFHFLYYHFISKYRLYECQSCI